MPTKTIHIIPKDGGWAVTKENADAFVVRQDGQWAVKKPHAERAIAMLSFQAAAVERDAKKRGTLYSTQKQALEAAREIGRRSSASQIVVHGRDGSIRWREVYGLPEVQTPPRKSDLGTKAIERAVSAVIRERL